MEDDFNRWIDQANAVTAYYSNLETTMENAVIKAMAKMFKG